MTRRKPNLLWIFALPIVVVTIALLLLQEVSARSDSQLKKKDHYKILNVPRSATVQEIKSAYRRKALNTHPDKRRDIPAELATEEFHAVVHAFEVLSDERLRRQYDRAHKKGPEQWQPPPPNPEEEDFVEPQPGTKEYYRWKIRDAQSRVLRLSSLKQLKLVILDNQQQKQQQRLERHLLICFVTHGDLHRLVSGPMQYPYPFAGNTGNIFWETLLQTTLVTYTNENDMTRYFKIPFGKDLESPLFLFGRQGDVFKPANFVRLQTNHRPTFQNWVWSQLQVKVQLVNHYPYPVRVYLVRPDHHYRDNIMKQEEQLVLEQLEPGQEATVQTDLSHDIWVKDKRFDYYETNPPWTHELVVGIYHLVSDEEGQVIDIEPNQCFD